MNKNTSRGDPTTQNYLKIGIGQGAFLFCKQDAALTIKARFKATRLLPKQLFAGWQFAKYFNQSPGSFGVRPSRRRAAHPPCRQPAKPSLPPCGKSGRFVRLCKRPAGV